VIPTYYKNHDRYVDMMRHAIALNGSFFNTQRMVQQYVLNAYLARRPYGLLLRHEPRPVVTMPSHQS
jgi:starch phosphorylase